MPNDVGGTPDRAFFIAWLRGVKFGHLPAYYSVTTSNCIATKILWARYLYKTWEKVMKKVKVLLLVVGIVQIVLGLLYMLMPNATLHWMGHSTVADDIAYPLGMLSSRFIVYGALLLLASRSPAEHRLLIVGMVWIQIIDLAVGLYFTLQGTVGIALSGFPMFNATVIALLLWLWMPSYGQTERLAR